jgi:glutamate racemase
MSLTPVDKQQIHSLFDQKQATLVVTDSGLGGMFIFARIAAGLSRQPLFRKVSLVYYNAWPDLQHGYNRLKDLNERIRVFESALEGMMQFQPDLILIACNTLSVLYDRTLFAGRAKIPVVDIIDFGVDMIDEKLAGRPDRQVVLLGTLTTIAERMHYRRLLERGVAPGQIVEQPCDQLATAIEAGPHSVAVGGMIDGFMKDASKKIDSAANGLYAALCCTHFGRCGQEIRQRLEVHTGQPVEILDPNERMGGFLFDLDDGGRYPDMPMDIRVVSRIRWDNAKVQANARAVRAVSPETAAALRSYAHMPDLFTIFR